MTQHPTILIAICQGFQERLLLTSGVLSHLAEHGARLLIASPSAREPDTISRYADRAELVLFAPQPGRVRNLYYSGRALSLWKHGINGALLNNYNRIKRSNRRLLTTIQMIRQLPWGGRLALDHLWMRHTAARRLLEQVRPDLVILASPGFHYPDAVLLNEAVRRGTRTAVVGQSWDNLSSKGYVHPKPDLLVCWGERMRDEAVSLQEFNPQKTVICGAPHFDVYHDLARFGTRSAVLERLGLDPARRLIVYGTSPRVHARDEFDVVKRVADWVERSPDGGPFQHPLQLLIRLHPQQVSGLYAHDLSGYRSLAGKHVLLDIPVMVNSKVSWQLAATDYERLPLLLSHADVAINCFSTFALDAVAAGKPTICVAFDGDEVRELEFSVRRYLSYAHLKPMVATGGVRVVQDYEGLQREIRAFLADPDRDASRRAELIRMQLCQIDGRSAERTAAALLRLTASPGMPVREGVPCLLSGERSA